MTASEREALVARVRDLAELLTDGRWTDELLYVRLEGNPSDGYRLTFRRVDAARTTGGRDA